MTRSQLIQTYNLTPETADKMIADGLVGVEAETTTVKSMARQTVNKIVEVKGFTVSLNDPDEKRPLFIWDVARSQDAPARGQVLRDTLFEWLVRFGNQCLAHGLEYSIGIIDQQTKDRLNCRAGAAKSIIRAAIPGKDKA